MASNIEKLEAAAAGAQTQKEKVDALTDLAWELRHFDIERALSLGQQAYDLAGSGEFEQQPYLQGQAASLTMMAFYNQNAGKLDVALEQCFEAMDLVESLPPFKNIIDTLRIIGWIYYFLGDLANALHYGLKALKLAQDLNDKLAEASSLDSLAMTYAATGDVEHALKSDREALEIARALNHFVLEAVISNNMACDLLGQGRIQEALDSVQRSLELARQHSLVDQQILGLDTLGQIYLKMGDAEKARKALEEGLAIGATNNPGMGQIYCLLSLGKIYMDQQDFPLALARIQQAREIAVQSNARPMQMECERTFSQVYELQGDYKQALKHFKAFFDINAEVNNEAAAKRLETLKVAHQVETAQRDAEIYRLRNVELQQQMVERAKIEAELERLATIDSLTNLFNRRHFFELAQREFDRAVRYHHPLTILVIDVDHFKRVNDQFGHATGDQVLLGLTTFIRHSLRAVDIIGRYGGEEFVVALVETNAEKGLLAAERIRHLVSGQVFQTQSGPVGVTISVGMASLPEGEKTDKGTLDKLVDRADRALFAAKHGGRNRVRVA